MDDERHGRGSGPYPNEGHVDRFASHFPRSDLFSWPSGAPPPGYFGGHQPVSNSEVYDERMTEEGDAAFLPPSSHDHLLAAAGYPAAPMMYPPAHPTHEVPTYMDVRQPPRQTDNYHMEEQSRNLQDAKPRASSLLGLQLFPMRLQFRAEVWQNRPNRIEIHGEGISDYFITNNTKMEKFPMHVVAKSPAIDAAAAPVKMPVVTLPNGPKFTIYNMDMGNPSVAKKRDFLELQVWKRSGDAGTAHLYFDEHASPERAATSSARSREEPIIADKMGLKQVTPFITISSKKSLRVKDLFLVAILKIGERIYFQLNVSFPQAPSNKSKAPTASRSSTPTSRPNSASGNSESKSPPATRHSGENPKRRKTSEASESDSEDVPVNAGPWFNPKSSTPPLTSSAVSNRLNANRYQGSIGFGAGISSGPFIHIESRQHQQSETVDEGAPESQEEPYEAENFLFSVLAPLEMRQDALERGRGKQARQILLRWMDEFVNQGLLPTREHVVNDVLLPLMHCKFFLGAVDRETVVQHLVHSYHHWRHGVFCVRVSRTRPPFLSINAVYGNPSDPSVAPTEFAANICVTKDESGTIIYYLETENDTVSSRSTSLLTVFTYLIYQTGWKGFEPIPVWPQLHVPFAPHTTMPGFGPTAYYQ